MSKAYSLIEGEWAVVYHNGEKVAAYSLLAEDTACKMASDHAYDLNKGCKR